MGAPQTLPADFFEDKKGPPDTLPANFFEKQLPPAVASGEAQKNINSPRGGTIAEYPPAPSYISRAMNLGLGAGREALLGGFRGLGMPEEKTPLGVVQSFGKGLKQLVAPPETTGEKALAITAPGIGLPIERTLEGIGGNVLEAGRDIGGAIFPAIKERRLPTQGEIEGAARGVGTLGTMAGAPLALEQPNPITRGIERIKGTPS